MVTRVGNGVASTKAWNTSNTQFCNMDGIMWVFIYNYLLDYLFYILAHMCTLE